MSATGSTGSTGSVPVQSAADLDQALTTALLAVPGVARIEPRLLSSLQRLTKPDSELVPLAAKIRNGRAELTVDISADVTVGGPAVQVAMAVQEQASAVIVEHGLIVGEIDVTVLEISAPS